MTRSCTIPWQTHSKRMEGSHRAAHAGSRLSHSDKQCAVMQHSQLVWNVTHAQACTCHRGANLAAQIALHAHPEIYAEWDLIFLVLWNPDTSHSAKHKYHSQSVQHREPLTRERTMNAGTLNTTSSYTLRSFMETQVQAQVGQQQCSSKSEFPQ